MRVPISWLREYVDFEDTPQGLAQRLTFSGTEVEAIETIGATYEGVAVAEILRVERHPNADKLTLCTVALGAGREQTVVCGAPNVAVGLKVPFAGIGTTLPNGMKLKPAKIRGVVSEGMLCAADELGLSTDHSGLLILDAAAAPGTPLATLLGPPEVVLDLEVTPNRPDCLSLLGMAREVAALYGTRLKRPATDFAETGRPAAELTRVAIEAPEDCPRYTARLLQGIRIGPSPAWMARRLELAGVRAINNVVDITNYVMLECGQPLHAFDQALLAEGRIVVRHARAGEQMATLDNIPRPLTEQTLVIADAGRPVAIAGVMGGAGSEIRAETATVLLESACFRPPAIRATSKRLGLSTESSYRFERGVDLGGVEWASRRAAALMAAHAGGQVAPGVVDVFPAPPAERKVFCRFDRVNTLLGLQATGAQIEQVFRALELPVEAAAAGNPAGCTVRVPGFRPDLEAEIDLVEEFARIHGLDQIPLLAAPRAQLVPGADDKPTQALFACRAHLVSLGLREILNYSLVAEPLLNLFDRAEAARRVVLPNPISSEQSVLRPSLVPQLVETLGRNLARQAAEAGLFEIGRVFALDERGEPGEEERLAIGLMGPIGRGGFAKHAAVEGEEVFLWLKGLWEQLARALNLGLAPVTPAERPWLEPGRAVALAVEGREVGVLGLLAPALRREWRMSAPVAVLEVRLAPLLGQAFARKSFRPLAMYPAISRDMALVVDQAVRHEEVLRVVRKAARKDLEGVALFDIYTGRGIDAGKKSMAYSCTYRSLERTLTDEEANRYHEAVKAALRAELGAEIREG